LIDGGRETARLKWTAPCSNLSGMAAILTALFWIVQDAIAFSIGFFLGSLHKSH
jgi:hypothetical protein